MQHSPMSLRVQRFLLSSQINELREYAHCVENVLASQAETVRTELERGANQLHEDVRQEYYENHAEQFQNLSNHFPNRFRYSLVSAAHNILETRVINICSLLQNLRRLELSLNDLKGNSPLERSKAYLTKVVVLPFNHDPWPRIVQFAKVRNLILHTNGHCPDEPQNSEVRKLSASCSGITFDTSDQMILGASFLHEQLAAIEEFFGVVFAAWKIWHTVGAAT